MTYVIFLILKYVPRYPLAVWKHFSMNDFTLSPTKGHVQQFFSKINYTLKTVIIKIV